MLERRRTSGLVSPKGPIVLTLVSLLQCYFSMALHLKRPRQMLLSRIIQSRVFHLTPLYLRIDVGNRRRRAALDPALDSSEASPHIPAGPKKDYSLKEGQTFTISIPSRNKPTAGNSLLGATSTSSSTTSDGSAFPLLPPPPSATKRH